MTLKGPQSVANNLEITDIHVGGNNSKNMKPTHEYKIPTIHCELSVITVKLQENYTTPMAMINLNQMCDLN